jgi:hypothetical protein
LGGIVYPFSKETLNNSLKKRVVGQYLGEHIRFEMTACCHLKTCRITLAKSMIFASITPPMAAGQASADADKSG